MRRYRSLKPWITALTLMAISAVFMLVYLVASRGSDSFILYDTLTFRRLVYFTLVYHYPFPAIWGTTLLAAYLIVARVLGPLKTWVGITHCVIFFGARVMIFLGWYYGRAANFDPSVDADGSSFLSAAFVLSYLGSRATYFAIGIMPILPFIPGLRTKKKR